MRLEHKCLCPISALRDRGGRLGQRTREGSERGLSVRQDPPPTPHPRRLNQKEVKISSRDQISRAGRAAAASIPPRGDTSAASRTTAAFDLTCLSWTAELFPAGGEQVRDHRVKRGTWPASAAGAPHRFLSPFYICVSEEVPAAPHSHFLRFPSSARPRLPLPAPRLDSRLSWDPALFMARLLGSGDVSQGSGTFRAPLSGLSCESLTGLYLPVPPRPVGHAPLKTR